MNELNFKPDFSKLLASTLFSYLLSILFFIFLISLLILFFPKEFFLDTFPFSKESRILYYGIIFVLVLVIITLIIKFFIELGFLKNTNFKIENSKLMRHSNFFNEVKKTVPTKQITNVDYSISWFFDRIFNTGSINIYTAGSSNEEITFFSIKNFKEKYETLLKLLKLDNKVEEELKVVKPSAKIASFLSLSTITFYFIGIYIYILSKGTINYLENIVPNANLFILIGYLILVFIFLICYYLIYSNESFHFYKKNLEYFDGFFNKHKATLSYERITDITLKKSFIGRLFGVGTILIETAGSSSKAEIKIGYVKGSEKIKDELKEILKSRGKN